MDDRNLITGNMSNRVYEYSKSNSGNLYHEYGLQGGGRSNRFHEYSKATSGNSRKLKELLLKNDNRVCADCNAPDPKWASANIGVFLCLKCCSVHRNLGSDISKVLSVTLDEWSEEDIDSMAEVGGNSSANSIYEAYLPKGFSKPKPNSSIEERTKFIRSKYELQEFLKPSLRMVSTKSSFKSCASNTDLEAFYSPTSSKNSADASESIGTLKIKVIRGINLAIRDFRSSDPYVILALGQQKVKTSMIKSNLNPVWNEELKLPVPQRYGALKLQVFDHDMFSADDIMGEAEVDLHPFMAAAIAFGDNGLPIDMQIGKWLKSSDNALMKDSTINIIGGKIKQEVHLKLQNVESGEIELELEWIPLLH
ncbi:ADP-ribosylation factor GTPase-activating protein AGD12 [Apostasia shenzhenica]|uniref:ADP-ribosylation factor GTPase-activating protein AGD12 n=1 Tax=Apostasia shenzhenica TaxID=1088818 RepID=A0A2I0A0V9_9ASPA|nr:ADP-ribosylation factor GTPase-activating protein AGD12 [Apostasia shenzhenica]